MYEDWLSVKKVVAESNGDLLEEHIQKTIDKLVLGDEMDKLYEKVRMCVNYTPYTQNSKVIDQFIDKLREELGVKERKAKQVDEFIKQNLPKQPLPCPLVIQ